MAKKPPKKSKAKKVRRKKRARARAVKKTKKVKRKPPRKPKKPRRRKKKSATKKVFDARPRDEGPPEGFDINLGQVIQDEAFAVISARFQDALANLPEGYSGRINVVPLADGSVDGELYIEVPQDSTTLDAEFSLYEAFGALAVGSKYWVSVGVRYVTTVDDEAYRRNKGMTEVQTNYQRATQSNIVEEHLVLRRHVIVGMERRLEGEQAHSVFIRLHWNQTDEQPKR